MQRPGMGRALRTMWSVRTPRLAPPRRKAMHGPRRSTLMATACDLSEEVYLPTIAPNDVFVADVAADVRVALGQRVCAGRRYCTVAFCGTESLNDWLYNLMLWMVERGDGSEGRVHAGFCRKWAAVSCKVIAALERIGCGRVLVTGHSLGGALATIASVDIARALPDVRVHAYTFGAPRCADTRFYAAPAPANLEKLVRCVHAGDFVHMFPPLPGYAHPPTAEVVFVGTRAYLARDPVARDDAAGESAHALWSQLQRAWRGRFGLDHHQMFAYRRAVLTGDIDDHDVRPRRAKTVVKRARE